MEKAPAQAIEQVVRERPFLAEMIVRRRLSKLTGGQIHFVQGSRRFTVGQAVEDGLQAHVYLKNDALFRRLLLSGTIGAAESFMNGDWRSDDLTALVRIIVRAQESLLALESGSARLGRVVADAYHFARRNTLTGSKKNITAHYNLGNDFFALMLDPTMTYSAAIFEPPTLSLEQASIEKIDRMCRKLKLTSEDRLLEIGTGWGSTAIHAASRYGCRVTTTTISTEQFKLAKERVAAAGLGARVEVILRDYRELTGTYDKILSIEMVEAIGASYLNEYFEKVSSLLQPGGLFAMQSITIVDQNYAAARKSADFIKRYIFPGGFLPSPTVLLQSATKSSQLRVTDYEDIGHHYAKTLSMWRRNLIPHQSKVAKLYGERFWRMWLFYLAYCEGAFLERYNACAQFVFERPRFFSQ